MSQSTDKKKLAVLGGVLVVLAAVAAWRFMGPSAGAPKPPDAIQAKQDEMKQSAGKNFDPNVGDSPVAEGETRSGGGTKRGG